MNHTHDHAPDRRRRTVVRDVIRIRGILGMQHQMRACRNQPFDRQLAVQHSHHHVAGCGRLRPVHDEQVAIRDAGVPHGMTGHLYDEQRR
ncbi:hypothetical protein BG22_02565 [Bifidobacterium sp. UTBIF-78]|nr:hypothetical protein BG22_02565 [Bifidobacterium sp. UTBIF-78]